MTTTILTQDELAKKIAAVGQQRSRAMNELVDNFREEVFPKSPKTQFEDCGQWVSILYKLWPDFAELIDIQTCIAQSKDQLGKDATKALMTQLAIKYKDECVAAGQLLDAKITEVASEEKLVTYLTELRELFGRAEQSFAERLKADKPAAPTS